MAKNLANVCLNKLNGLLKIYKPYACDCQALAILKTACPGIIIDAYTSTSREHEGALGFPRAMMSLVSLGYLLLITFLLTRKYSLSCTYNTELLPHNVSE